MIPSIVAIFEEVLIPHYTTVSMDGDSGNVTASGVAQDVLFTAVNIDGGGDLTTTITAEIPPGFTLLNFNLIEGPYSPPDNLSTHFDFDDGYYVPPDEKGELLPPTRFVKIDGNGDIIPIPSPSKSQSVPSIDGNTSVAVTYDKVETGVYLTNHDFTDGATGWTLLNDNTAVGMHNPNRMGFNGDEPANISQTIVNLTDQDFYKIEVDIPWGALGDGLKLIVNSVTLLTGMVDLTFIHFRATGTDDLLEIDNDNNSNIVDVDYVLVTPEMIFANQDFENNQVGWSNNNAGAYSTPIGSDEGWTGQTGRVLKVENTTGSEISYDTQFVLDTNKVYVVIINTWGLGYTSGPKLIAHLGTQSATQSANSSHINLNRFVEFYIQPTETNCTLKIETQNYNVLINRVYLL